MQRRHFLARLTQALTALGVMPAFARANPYHPDTAPLHLQDCRIAGSHYYDCRAVLANVRAGDPLNLLREPDNRHDPRAIAVFWRRHKLGYLPRLDNAAAASLLDHGHMVSAEVIGVDDPREEWEAVTLRVWVAATLTRTGVRS